MAYTTIDHPSAYYQTALYSGNNTSQSITLDGNSNLQPDVVWIKERNGIEDHCIFDSSRSGSERLSPNTTGSTWDDASNVTAFDSDGFSIVSNDQLNDSGNTQVAWCWKVNGGTTTTNDASATSVGSQDSVYQANTTAGFSIVTWTGPSGSGVGTNAHGLGAVPHLMIVKCRSASEPWEVYHHKNTTAPETDYLRLNTTAATADSAHVWADTAPTSTVFTVGDSGSTNEDSKTYVAYLWKEIQGYSKFGSYTGNGNADGPFVYTGFKPAFLIVKNTSDGDDQWLVWDNKRSPTNPVDDYLAPSASDAESANSNWAIIDFVSNGFKLRSSDISYNQSGYKYIYIAFAEQPFVSSEGVPCTAR